LAKEVKRSVIVLPMAPALFVAGLVDPGNTSGSLILLLAIGLAVVL
jgi:hypothetical protein